MHPILTQRGRLLLYLVAWSPIAALLAALLVFAGNLSWAEALALAAPLILIYSFLCLSAWYLCRTFPLQDTNFLKLLGVFTPAALLSGSLWTAIGWMWAMMLSSIPLFARITDRYAVQSPLFLGTGTLLFFLAVLVHYLMATFEKAREAEKQSLELKVLAREAELKALKAQIDPHFLFNSLNSISALTTTNPAGAREMCQLLADFFRKSLRLGHETMITLREEMSLVTNFLAIEKIRLGSRLNVEMRVEEICQRCLVPPLLLQPLVENSVRHGISQLLEGGTIRIQAEIAGGCLIVTVENPYEETGSKSRTKGIGLQNTRGRLASQFGSDARMEVERMHSCFRVRTILPARISEKQP